MMLLSAYQFTPLENLPLLRERLLAAARRLGLKGTVLLAPEGINFSLGGPEPDLEAWLTSLATEHGIAALIVNRQSLEVVPFLRLKVRIRPEIITFDSALDPGVAQTGEALEPAAWHALLESRGVQLVDTRNDYEVAIGTFRDAVNPEIESFTEFGPWALEHLDPSRPVAMFCTGGVRCEKASAWLLAQGYSQVYHLRGGILSYLQAYADQPSLWQGECFVFDDRVSVDHAIRPSGRPICAGCRKPHDELPGDGMPPVDDLGGCRLCGQQFDPARLAGIRERVRQIALARQRGASHLGPQSSLEPAAVPEAKEASSA
ncbi:MAG: oxygen-dependent tRNA uridine(34) hydroxylase TrhO [Wenzhouxiangella sp.]